MDVKCVQEAATEFIFYLADADAGPGVTLFSLFISWTLLFFFLHSHFLCLARTHRPVLSPLFDGFLFVVSIRALCFCCLFFVIVVVVLAAVKRFSSSTYMDFHNE